MNHNDILKNRAERMKAFQAAAGGGKSGVVPAGMAAFLLAVSASRIKALVMSGRLETIAQGGQRWILFSSLCKYAEAGEQHQGDVSNLVMSKPVMSKPVVPKPVVPKPVMPKPVVPKPVIAKAGITRKVTSKRGMSKPGTIGKGVPVIN